MAMAEAGHDQPGLADLAGAHHRAGLAHHRIGRIAIVHRADLAGPFRDRDDLFAFLDGHRHRLFAQHMKAGLQKGLGDLVMGRVGRGHRDQIDPI